MHITLSNGDPLPASLASAYEKWDSGDPGIPLSDLKPVGLWRYPEALKRLAEALRGSLKPSEAP